MIICVINLLMLQLRVFFVANVAFTRFFCRKCRDYALFCRKCRDYALFGVEFWQKFWQKFLEILRILAEILRKKLACGASAAESQSGLSNISFTFLTYLFV